MANSATICKNLTKEVEKNKNIVAEDKTEVRPSNSEQISDLKSISEEESIVKLPRLVPEVPSEVLIEELAKSSEKEQLEEEASFVDSKKPTDLPPVVPCLDQISTEELNSCSIE